MPPLHLSETPTMALPGPARLSKNGQIGLLPLEENTSEQEALRMTTNSSLVPCNDGGNETVQYLGELISWH
jgi:hypothetical protein